MSGGHPALDLANTIDSRRGRWGPDFLHSFDDLLVLAKRTAVFDSEAVSGLREKASADPEWARAVVDEAVKLREAIHQVFIAEDTGRAYPSAALKVVETAAREGRSRERLSHSRLGFAWSLLFDELEDVGRAFALTATQLLIARNDRREVRECKGDNCGWLFLDHSKGGRRSASSFAAMLVEPTRSQNITVIGRRSATPAGDGRQPAPPTHTPLLCPPSKALRRRRKCPRLLRRWKR
jgi:predicted RNA-binding Zn ribbon-like protein